MSCYHAAEGKPEQFTPEEKQKFLVVQNHFFSLKYTAMKYEYVDLLFQHNVCFEN